MLNFPEDQYIKVGDNRIRYWHLGEQGETLLLVHGIGASCEYWYKNVFELAKHFRVLVVDLPGFGKSDKPDLNYTLDFFAKFVADFLDALNVERVHVIAHSLGGGLSLQFCINHVSRVNKLVLVDNIGFAREVIIFFRLMGLPIIGNLLLDLKKPLFSKALRKNVYDDRVITDEFIDAFYPIAQNEGVSRTIKCITKNETNLCGIKKRALQSIWHGLNKLDNTPTLILWGKQDELLPCKPHVTAARLRMPNAEIEVWDECGHITQIEHSDAFNQRVLSFLSEDA